MPSHLLLSWVPLGPCPVSDSLSPSLRASICFSVLKLFSLVCLSALSLSLSLVLCLPPPLPAPPSPHPELSLGNRKFGGSERYQEAQLLPPRDKVRVGVEGWMGDGGAQNPPPLPPGPAARRDWQELCHPFGAQPYPLGTGPDEPASLSGFL